jgi:lipoic acid synthetase
LVIQQALCFSIESMASHPTPTSDQQQQLRAELARMPEWLRRPIGKASELSEVQRIIKDRQIHTICEEGRCPNRGECYANRTATFLLMGAVCTRACAFCQVDKGHAPMPLDPQEPEKVAEAVRLLNLRYVVLTSVARDDLPDHGANWFVKVMDTIRQNNPQTEIEVLTPDFWGGSSRDAGQADRVHTVVKAKPACYNHNLETIKRLQGPVRRGAKYDRSLRVLELVKQFDPTVATKSGLMVGHGETEAELIEAMEDLRNVDCDRITIGQYMRPSLDHRPVVRYWTPAEFDHLGNIARELGFSHVRSGPLVRSSYHAGESP